MLKRLLPLKVEDILLQSHLILMLGSCSSCPVLILLHTSIFLILLKVLAIISFTHSSGDGSLTYSSHFWSIFSIIYVPTFDFIQFVNKYTFCPLNSLILLCILSLSVLFIPFCFPQTGPFLFSFLAFVFYFCV